MNEENENNQDIAEELEDRKQAEIEASKKQIMELMDLSSIPDSTVDIDIMLGSADITLHGFLRLVEGDIVALDKQAGDGVDIFVNRRIIGTGAVQVINERFAIKIEDSLNVKDVVDYLHDEQYLG